MPPSTPPNTAAATPSSNTALPSWWTRPGWRWRGEAEAPRLRSNGRSHLPNPLTPQPLLWPSPPSSGRDPNPQKALRFHDLRTLQRPRFRATLATPVGRKGDLRLQEQRFPAEILRARDVPLPVRAHPYW